MNAASIIRVRRNKPLARPGFSLLELMLVLVIIGIVIGAVAINIAGTGTRAKIKITRQILDTVSSALKQYHLEYSAYPPSLDTLYTMKPPMLDASKSAKDAWDSPLIYEARPHGTEQFTLISTGEDKQVGTEDDLAVGDAAK